jgi:peptidoglycan DL-endopeptidase CwlO
MSALSITLILSLSTGVLADPAWNQNQIDEQNKIIQQELDKQTQTQANLDGTVKSQQTLQSNISSLETKIESILKNINTVNANISQTTSEIATTQKELDKAEADIAGEQKTYDDRMRAMYKSGDNSYLFVLFDSNGFTDFLDKLGMVKNIIQYDKKLLEDLKSKKEVINNKKKDLETKNSQLLSLKANNNSQLANLNATQNSQKQLVTQYSQQASNYTAAINASKEVVKKANLTLAQLIATEPVKGKYPISGNAIVAFGQTLIGSPYVWGANGEIITQSYINSMWSEALHHFTDNDLDARTFLARYIGRRVFDCSGFVTYVFNHFGIGFGGGRPTTWTMIAYGTPVSQDQLQPGDVVYFDGNEHVGIYYGIINGQAMVLNAPSTGNFVTIQPMSDFDYFAARRMK